MSNNYAKNYEMSAVWEVRGSFSSRVR